MEDLYDQIYDQAANAIELLWDSPEHLKRLHKHMAQVARPESLPTRIQPKPRKPSR